MVGLQLLLSVFSHAFRTRPQTLAITSFFRASFQNHHLWPKWFQTIAKWFQTIGLKTQTHQLFSSAKIRSRGPRTRNTCSYEIFQKKVCLIIINHPDLTAILIMALLSTNYTHLVQYIMKKRVYYWNYPNLFLYNFTDEFKSVASWLHSDILLSKVPRMYVLFSERNRF